MQRLEVTYLAYFIEIFRKILSFCTRGKSIGRKLALYHNDLVRNKSFSMMLITTCILWLVKNIKRSDFAITVVT